MIDWFPWRRFTVKSFVSGRLWLWDWFDTYKICWILSVIPDFERGMRPHAGADHKTSNLWHQNVTLIIRHAHWTWDWSESDDFRICTIPKLCFLMFPSAKVQTSKLSWPHFALIQRSNMGSNQATSHQDSNANRLSNACHMHPISDHLLHSWPGLPCEICRRGQAHPLRDKDLKWVNVPQSFLADKVSWKRKTLNTVSSKITKDRVVTHNQFQHTKHQCCKFW